MDLSVDVQAGLAGDVTLIVRGNLDQSTTAPFRKAVNEVLSSHPARLTVDLRMVTFVDSSGLNALVSARRACDDVGCRITLEGISAALSRALHTTGLIDYLNVRETP